MIEFHVVNFDLSRRLHELGVKKPSIFYWGIGDYGDPNKIWILPFQNEENWTYDKKYPAYTASELLEMLPSDLKIDGYICYLEIYKIDDIFYVQYVHDENPHSSSEDEKICNALAKMLIYLIENKLVDVKEINGD